MTQVQTNTIDEKQIKLAREREKLTVDQQVLDFKKVLSTLEGRRFIWRMLKFAGVFEQSFNNSGSITAFNEGRRSVGLMLMLEIQREFPEAYLTMVQESKGNEK